MELADESEDSVAAMDQDWAGGLWVWKGDGFYARFRLVQHLGDTPEKAAW
jgi:hypothetical protein